MCLAIPGEVIRWIDRDPLFASAEVNFGGVRRVCHMACVLDVVEGEYVLVHAGLAISRVDTEQALRLLAELAQMNELVSEADQN